MKDEWIRILLNYIWKLLKLDYCNWEIMKIWLLLFIVIKVIVILNGYVVIYVMNGVWI